MPCRIRRRQRGPLDVQLAIAKLLPCRNTAGHFGIPVFDLPIRRSRGSTPSAAPSSTDPLREILAVEQNNRVGWRRRRRDREPGSHLRRQRSLQVVPFPLLAGNRRSFRVFFILLRRFKGAPATTRLRRIGLRSTGLLSNGRHRRSEEHTSELTSHSFI